MGYSGTENTTLNVDSLSTSNLILNGSTSFNTTINTNTPLAEIIEPLKRQIEELKALFLTQTAVTTGSIIPFAGNAVEMTSFSILPPPIGYDWCFGQIVSKTDEKYANLYSVIGDYWNTSDSLTENQFQLPDLRNVFLRGCPDYLADSSSNRDVGDYQSCGAPEIWAECEPTNGGQDLIEGYLRGALAYRVYSKKGASSTDYKQSVLNGFDFKASRCSSVYQEGLTEVRPDNKAVNYIIKL